jgi:hypothetical protein
MEPTGAHRVLSTTMKSSSGESASAGRRGGRGAHRLGRRSSWDHPSAHGGRDGVRLGQRLTGVSEATLRWLGALRLAHPAT